MIKAAHGEGKNWKIHGKEKGLQLEILCLLLRIVHGVVR